jgi:Flp pilus assembly protein TadG
MSANRGTSKSVLKRHRGSAQIEFLLSFFTIVFVIYGVIEISMAVYAMSVLANAAREGTRYAIVHGARNGSCSGPNTPACGDATGANVQAVVADYARFTLHDTSAMTVSVSWPDGNIDQGSLVQVDVTYAYSPWIKLPWTSPTLKASSQAHILN